VRRATKIITLILVLLVLTPALSFLVSKQVETNWWWTRSQKEIKVLTINLLFSEIEERDLRLNRIAQFIADQKIDLILLQEVVGGTLAGTLNSALDLQRKLECFYGLDYHLSYRLANGLPGILTVGNAILSKYDILYTVAKILPFEVEIQFRGYDIPLKRRAMMSRIRIPGYGKINVYNTHLCANCDPAARLEQAEVLRNFILTWEKFNWFNDPVILGGDFNTDLNVVEEKPVYELIMNLGFVDSYAQANDCSFCCQSGNLCGCTYLGWSPYQPLPLAGPVEGPKRIDYIFVKNRCQVVKSIVVFNGQEEDCLGSWPYDWSWVSDHSGVLTTLLLY